MLKLTKQQLESRKKKRRRMKKVRWQTRNYISEVMRHDSGSYKSMPEQMHECSDRRFA